MGRTSCGRLVRSVFYRDAEELLESLDELGVDIDPV